MTAPVRSTTVPLIVPVMGSAGPCCGAVAFGAPEGCGDCARAGKEQSRRTPSKGMRGHSQGRLPLPESNLQRVPPKDFLPEPFLAEFTVEPLFTVCPSAYFRQGFDGLDVPKVSTLVFWMTSASFGLDESKGRERFRATPPARLARKTLHPRKSKTAGVYSARRRFCANGHSSSIHWASHRKPVRSAISGISSALYL